MRNGGPQIAVLKREALPPMEMDSQVLRSHGELKEFQVFRVHGQHHHHFATRPDFLQDLLAFPVDRYGSSLTSVPPTQEVQLLNETQ
eukprot:741366-Rhodomonas_salina.2